MCLELSHGMSIAKTTSESTLHKESIVTESLGQDQLNSIFESLNAERAKRQSWRRSVRNFDFLNPDRLTRNTRKILENIHNSFSKIFAAHLSNNLRANVNIQLVSLDQMSINEFTESMNNPTCLYQFGMNPYGRDSVVEFHPSLAFFIVDRILGGPGHGSQFLRELTEIEQNIMSKLVIDSLDHLRSAWNRIAELQTTKPKYFSSPSYVQFAKSGESVISAAFEVEIEKTQNMFMITYPYYLIDKLIPQTDKKKRPTAGQASQSEKLMIQRNLELTQAPVSVTLGRSKLSIEELVNLREGDVVLLNRLIADELELIIGGQTRFLGKAGVVSNRLAFKVVQRFKK